MLVTAVTTCKSRERLEIGSENTNTNNEPQNYQPIVKLLLKTDKIVSNPENWKSIDISIIKKARDIEAYTTNNFSISSADDLKF